MQKIWARPPCPDFFSLMHIHFLDPYHPGQSVIHHLDPRVKFVLALAFILTTMLTPVGAWAAYILLLALILSIELVSGVGVLYVLTRALLATPFVLAALPLIVTVPGAPVLTGVIGPVRLTITVPGVERFLSIAFKSWLSLQMAIVLATTTSFPQLLMAMHALHVPRLFVAIVGLMWRYLFVLADEALRLLRARAARSGASREAGRKIGGSLVWRAQVTGGMVGNLFVRSLERGDRIYAAMVARGYDGQVRTLPLPPLGLADRLWLSVGILLLLVILFFSALVGP